MEQKKLIEILRLHEGWLQGNNDGVRANLQGADLRYADLVSADLQGANLKNANLKNANLKDANLQGADLRYADLVSADLQGANLQGANLRDTNLWNANLVGADLYGSNLQGARLKDANLQGADLRCAKGIIFIGPIGSRNDILYAVKHSEETMFKTGCFWGTYEEFIESVNLKHKGIMAEIYVQAADVMVKILHKETETL